MIFVQSRNRRKSLERFFSVGKPTLPGRVLVDDDDDSYWDMVLPKGWQVFQQPRASSSEILNRAYREWPDEPFYAQIGDDYVCNPKGWDVMLAKSCGFRKISWGNDGRWGDRLCTSFFVGGELVRMFDWFAHPDLQHLYVDSVWWMIAKGAGLGHYRPDVETLHINVKDQTYHERRIGNDHNVFQRIRDEEMDKLIQLAAAFNA